MIECVYGNHTVLLYVRGHDKATIECVDEIVLYYRMIAATQANKVIYLLAFSGSE